MFRMVTPSGMRCHRFLSLLSFLLLVTGAALAVKHHENYDQARVDLQIINEYIKDAKDAINESLGHCMALEADQAIVWSLEFSRKVDAAERTLEKVPEEVYSYPVLFGYIAGLSRIEVNLTDTVNALSKSVLASKDIALEDGPVWTEAAIKEDLTRIDNAFLDLELGLSMLGPYSAALVDDLVHFEEIGGDVSHQKALASKVGGLVLNISIGLDGPWELLSRFMVHPMGSWASETGHLVSEEALDLELKRCSGLLLSVLPLLTGGMKVPVGSVTPSLVDAASSSSSFQANQTTLLFSLDLLEMNGTGLNDMVHHFEKCGSSLSAMEDALTSMKEDLAILSPYDNGSVAAGLEALDALMESYRKRLLEVELLQTRFEAMTDIVNRTFWANVLYVDIDDDGNLTASEVGAVSLGSGPSGQAEVLGREWYSLRSELMSLPEWMVLEIGDTQFLIDELVESAVQFTSSHYDLERDLAILLAGARSEASFKGLMECFGHLSVMMTVVESVPATLLSLNENGITTPGLYVAPLDRMLELYKGFLLDLASQLNKTLLSIKVWPSVVPYDLMAQYSIVLINRDGTGALTMADGPLVEVDLDGTVIERLTVRNGMANGSLIIDRDMALGEHVLSVEFDVGPEGFLNDSDILTVRRLGVVLTLSAARTVLDIDGNVTVRAEARDELLRPYKGTLVLGDKSYPLDGQIDIVVEFDRLGEQILVVSIPPTDHFEGAKSPIFFIVNIASVMVLTVDRTSVYVDEDLKVNISVLVGEGQAALLLDDREMGLGMMRNGTWKAFSINASELGPGKHVLQAKLVTTVSWARSGWSEPVQVEVLEKVPDDVLPPIPNDTVPWNEKEKPSFWDRLVPDWGFLDSLVVKVVLIMLLAASFAVIIVILVVRLRRGRTGRVGKRLPTLYMRSRVKRVVDRKGPEVEGPIKKGLDRPEEEVKVAELKGREDQGREELIRMYLELIDGSSELGIKRSMTHREAANRLAELGLDRKVSERLSSNFERSIYAMGVPERSDLKEFGRDKGSASGFIASLRERLRPILGPGRGKG